MSLLRFRSGLAVVALLCTTAAAQAQTEDVEPRVIGTRGATTIGVSGFLDTFASTENDFPWQATVLVDVNRFITSKIVARGGVIGSALFAGANADERPTGPGASAIHALGGLFYYFTPGAMVSLYSGAEYRVPLTDRADKEPGTLFGQLGLQAAVSSRASMFVQAGYGMRLTRGESDELQTRVAGEMGIRIRF